MEAEGEPQETRGKITRSFGEITFNSKFDSGNLDKVEEVHSDTPGRHCFNLWTAPDCAGTQYENGNRSWFYFSVAFQPAQEAGRHCHTIRICLMNLNRQMRLYQQGLTPLVKTIPGKGGWERMRERPLCEMGEEGMTLTFEYSPPESNGRQQQQRHLVYFAFCFPYSYSECQRYLGRVDKRMKTLPQQNLSPSSSTAITTAANNSGTTTNTVNKDSIYYHRQLLCYSLDGLRIDLLTISSHHGITMETEPRLPGLFPDPTTDRARMFKNKKIVFITSRVHPGETPSSYVFNGFLEFILNPDDPRSRTLREHFVFKMIPILNPDGVYRGHYRTDSRGINLNRVYINPKWELHPSVFCVRSLIMYYHMGVVSPHHGNDSGHDETSPPTCECAPLHNSKSKEEGNVISNGDDLVNEKLSKFKGNVAVYVDLHAHATKRGCFMYGNHFSSDSDHAECMLLPKLVSLNSVHFDFSHCVFSERNMCAFDKREDVVGKEGSGRVAIYKATGLLQSYTLECNYNSGARMNGLTVASMDGGRATPPSEPSVIPYRYTPSNYIEVGRGLAIAVLDLYQLNPWSRLHSTQYSTLNGLRQSLLQTVQENREKSEQAKSRSRLFPKQSNFSSRSGGSKTNTSPSAAASGTTPTTTNNTTPGLHLDIVTNDQELPTACHISGSNGTPPITLCTNRKSTNTDRQMNTDRVLLRRHTSPSLLIRPQSSHKFIYSSSYPYIFNSSSGNFKQTLPPALAQNGIGGGCIVSDLTRSIRLPTVSSTNQQHHHTLFRAIKKQNTAPNKDGLAITGCESLNLLNKFTVIGRKVASSNSYCAGLAIVDKETNEQLQLSEGKHQPPKIGQLKTSNPLRRIKKSSPSHTTSKGKQKKLVTRGGVATVRGKTRKSHPFSPTSRDLSSPTTTVLKDNPRPVAQVVSTGRRK